MRRAAILRIAKSIRRAGGETLRYFGWYPRRRGILDHLECGAVSLLDVSIHDVLSLWADHRSGVCFASAEKLKALCPAEFSYKSIQRSLAKLERIGWIKRWVVRGKRGNYPVLVCRYFVRDSSMTWWSVSGERTSDWRDVKFDPVHDESFNRPPGVRSGVHDVSGLQEVISETEESRTNKPLVGALGLSVCESQNQNLRSGNAFKKAQQRFRQIVGKGLGSLSSRVDEWNALVGTAGADVVIAAVGIWARENTEFLGTAGNPLAHFLKNSEEYVEAVKLRPLDSEPDESNDWNMPTVEDDLPPDWEETQRKIREEREKKKAKAEAIRPPGYVPPLAAKSSSAR